MYGCRDGLRGLLVGGRAGAGLGYCAGFSRLPAPVLAPFGNDLMEPGDPEDKEGKGLTPSQLKEAELKIAYTIQSRVDLLLKEDTIDALAESGLKEVWVGAESGSQKIIDAMDRRVDVVKTREMINLAKQHGIEAGTFIMLGYPGETKEDIKYFVLNL